MKYLKHLAALILHNEIVDYNRRFESLNKWSIKLEDAIVDEDKKILVQAMYNVAQRRDQDIKITFGKSKKIKNSIDFKVYNFPIVLSLLDKKNKNLK